MAGFPSTRPAFTMTVMIKEPHLVGSISRGTPLTVVPIVGGTVRSEPGFEPAFNARFQGTGNDYIHTDPTGKHMRLDAHVVLLTDDGAMIYLKYYGVIDITPELSAILAGRRDATSTEFGHSFTHLVFETGTARYKDLETGVFVGAGRFVIDQKNPICVEYKISRVVKGADVDSSSGPNP